MIDVPADKNLGTALVSRQLYEQQIDVTFERSFVRLDEAEALALIDQISGELIEIVRDAVGKNTITDIESDYLLCLRNCWRWPHLRLLWKVHKKNIDTRLISSGTKWITCPLDVFVSRALQPICESLPTVAKDTSAVIDLLTSVPPRPNLNIASFDVEKLYPTLDTGLVLLVVRNHLVRFYTCSPVPLWGFLVEFILQLLHLVLKGQIVTFKPRCKPNAHMQFWRQVLGIATGLSCGVQIANITLFELDLHVADTLGWRLVAYKRFVDDALCVHDNSLDINTILLAFNSWHASITVTHDSAERDGLSTSFLDLDIKILNCRIHFSTFRKPANTYAYTPFNSAHPVSCFKGIVATELFRLLRTNETCKDYEFQCGFFLQKLRYRGYPAKFCSNIFKRFPWTSKNAILNRASSIPTEKQQRKIIGFRIRYCFGIDTVGITSVLHDCSDILPNDFLCKVKFITSYSIALNNFRSRYNRFL